MIVVQKGLGERNSTVELLRIACMLSIISHHCVVHGGMLAMENCTNKWIGMLILPAGKIGFDCFVAISTWYMAGASFKAQRVVKIWLQVLFYNVVFMALTVWLGNGYAAAIGRRTWLGAFFPMMGNSHGFAASYIAYCLLAPFLGMIAQKLNQRSSTILVCLLSCIQVFSVMIGSAIAYTQPMASEVLLFVLFYFIAYHLKTWPIDLQFNRPWLSAIFIFVWGLTSTAWVVNSIFPDARWSAVVIGLTGNESSLTNILAGFSLFLLVKDVKMPTNKAINRIATTTFGVLLYHDHNYFRPVVWHRFIRTESWYYVPPARFIAYMLIATIFVFTFGMLIDMLRQCIEKKIIKTKPFIRVCDYLMMAFESEKTGCTLK